MSEADEVIQLREENKHLKSQYEKAAQSFGGLCRVLDESGQKNQRLEADIAAATERAERAERERDAIVAESVDAVRGLLMCSLPRDVSGQRMVETARIFLEKHLIAQSPESG